MLETWRLTTVTPQRLAVVPGSSMWGISCQQGGRPAT
jgi:hypothetical protein